MKTKHTAQFGSFSLELVLCSVAVCSVITGTLLAFFHPEAPAKASHPAGVGLTFAERVAYQRAIEEVYWHHRIWPKSNASAKPPLDQVMSQAQIESKVADYLRTSQVLEDDYHHQTTAEQLQAEMDRMAQHSKHPKVLRELFVALGNDPFVIAECLARPMLVGRTLATVESLRQRLESRRARAERQVPVTMAAVSANYTLPVIASPSGGCTDDTWTRGGTSVTNAPDARELHTAVWTGSEMIVWGGVNITGYLNTGGRYDPGTDSWTDIGTTGAPSARGYHTAVWTGSEMIVWGGEGLGPVLNTGGKYNPGSDSWRATAGVRIGRQDHTAVWTGSEMIVWGGFNGVRLNIGDSYNPITNSWTGTTVTNAPAARHYHTAVWTGNEMIVWGGVGPLFNTGGRYDPGTDSWIATTTTSAPTARYYHTAVWTGNEMIIWGGFDNGSALDTGGRYNPGTNSWTATSSSNAPAPRFFHRAMWTSSEMIVWGGWNGDHLNSGGRYCAQFTPPTPTPTGTPSATPRTAPTQRPHPTPASRP